MPKGGISISAPARDHMGQIEVPQSPLVSGAGTKLDKIDTTTAALVTGSIGFRFPAHIRTEA